MFSSDLILLVKSEQNGCDSLQSVPVMECLLMEKVDLNSISLMKKVGSSVCCPYLTRHTVQLSVTITPLCLLSLKKRFAPSSFLGAQFVFASKVLSTLG